MPTPVDVFYMANRAIGDYLLRTGEISLKATFDAVFSKGLLIAAASHFEECIQRDIKTLAAAFSTSPLLVGLIQSKAIERQYHTYFDWNTLNANRFFGIFGSGFSEFMKEEVKQNTELNDAIRAFMDLGRQRNNLVHADFADAPLEKTPDEVYAAYQLGMRFIEALPLKYREFTNRPAV